MLLRGMGVATNDVSVVTNVTADHLGLQGIDTLDQLAEVKAIVTTVTKPDGWVVLNGEDPRVWAMRHTIQAKPWAFSVDPDAPALRESITMGGRGITVLDGEIVVLTPGRDPDRLVRIVDVPVTLSGLSRYNTANALAAAAAALGLGLPRAAVVDGLRSFTPDPVLNEGRLNTYTLPLDPTGRSTVILDMAHNEAGLEALLEVARGSHGPRRPGAPRSRRDRRPPRRRDPGSRRDRRQGRRPRRPCAQAQVPARTLHRGHRRAPADRPRPRGYR